jgi:hypothetical protein
LGTGLGCFTPSQPVHAKLRRIWFIAEIFQVCLEKSFPLDPLYTYDDCIDLSNNILSGPITLELGSLANLTLLDLFNNHLFEPIPAELGSLTNLITLNL